MRTVLIIAKLIIPVLIILLLMRACMGDSYRFSSTYRLYETGLDGQSWYTIESSKPGDDGPPFSQHVDGVQQKGNLIYIWVNGSQYPDYYCIDVKKETYTRIPIIPGFVNLVPAKQFLQEH